MFVFNNNRILKTGSDVQLGSVYSEEIKFSFEIYQNLMSEKIQELIDIYVGDRLASNNSITKQDVLDDLAIMISEKFRVYVYDVSSENLTDAIINSEQYGRFMSNMKEGFDIYENKMASFDTSVPVEINYAEDSYYNEDNVSDIQDELNIIDFIETLYEYDLPILQ